MIDLVVSLQGGSDGFFCANVSLNVDTCTCEERSIQELQYPSDTYGSKVQSPVSHVTWTVFGDHTPESIAICSSAVRVLIAALSCDP
jgi:hypothetical protein